MSSETYCYMVGLGMPIPNNGTGYPGTSFRVSRLNIPFGHFSGFKDRTSRFSGLVGNASRPGNPGDPGILSDFTFSLYFDRIKQSNEL